MWRETKGEAWKTVQQNWGIECSKGCDNIHDGRNKQGQIVKHLVNYVQKFEL